MKTFFKRGPSLKIEAYVLRIEEFLSRQLRLELHPNKIIERKFDWGIDFCGYVVLPHYILPRTKTKRRIINKATDTNVSTQSLQSYLGYFSHAKSYTISQVLKNIYFLNNENF